MSAEGRDPMNVIRQAAAVGAIQQDGLTVDLLNLIKNQICKPRDRDATDSELAYFIGVCMRTQLDPFAKQIYAIFRHDSRIGRERMSIQTSIDGSRLIAERSGKYEGVAPPMWCDDRGAWSDVWVGEGNPHAARVGAWRTGARELSIGLAYWKLYHDGRSPMWKDGGPHMLAKCAEALALRRAFPQELSGLYTVDEMARDDALDGQIIPEPQAEQPKRLDAPVVAALERGFTLSGWDETTLQKNLVDLNVDDVRYPLDALARLTPEGAEELNRRLSDALDAREAANA